MYIAINSRGFSLTKALHSFTQQRLSLGLARSTISPVDLLNLHTSSKWAFGCCWPGHCDPLSLRIGHPFAFAAYWHDRR